MKYLLPYCDLTHFYNVPLYKRLILGSDFFGFSVYNKDNKWFYFGPITASLFSHTKEDAMLQLDKERLAEGYTFLTEERAKKIITII